MLGTGLSKTGTTSLHKALQILGFKSLHHDTERLNDILAGSNIRPDFQRYDDLDAVVDLPTAYFYEEILKAYPECKFIHTIRDEDAWWNSIANHFNKEEPLFERDQKPFMWSLRNYVYGSATAYEYLYRKKYREHNARVLCKIPKERLLVMDITVGDGWEKLCPFLGTETPKIPFPNLNQRTNMDLSDWPIAKAEMEKIIEPGRTFILVELTWFDETPLKGRRQVPFLEHNGEYWGRPKDDITAINELERMRQTGAKYIVFAWPVFWWLEYYADFHKYRRSKYHCVLENERLVIFQLRP
ncbi:MAG: sulfotransferase family protein [Thermodesulfobacteriota bacterium]